MKIAIGVVLGLVVVLVAAYYTVAELGQEVVVLHRFSPDGEPDRIRLWIVDGGEVSWIHHGTEEAPWIRRLATDPEVRLERGGRTRAYRATPDQASHALVHRRMGEKYGAVVRALGTSADGCEVVPVKLQRIGD